MKKRGILFAMVVLMGIPFAVKASETGNVGIKSHGNIFYEDVNGSVKIYAEDILLLQKKLESIPDEIFDPVLYSHNHVWEYKDITDQGHTKHCERCGSKYDVVNMHIAAEDNPYTIFFDGHEYPGYEKVCECGYKWETEIYHNIVCTPKDETYHTLSCALKGTSYCTGMETYNELHVITLSPIDDSHHQRGCSACGYKGAIEGCVFEIEDEKAADGEIEIEDMKEVRKYCECGNFITESKMKVANLEITESETKKLPEISVSENDISISGNDIIKENIKKKGEN